MDNGSYASELHPRITYHPKIKETQIVRFIKFVEKKYQVQLNDYWDLYEWSIKNYPEFWACVWHFFDIVHSQPYTEVFDRSKGFWNMEWFKGAALNYAENVFRYKDSKNALIVADDYENIEYVTYQQMYDEVCEYAAALRSAGIGKGDIVSSYLANRKEAVYAFLATAAVGGIWCAVLPVLGSKGALGELEEVAPKILFTGGSCTYDGKEIPLDENARVIVEGLSSLKKVVIIPPKPSDRKLNYDGISKSCTLSEFLQQGKNGTSKCDFKFEQLSFNDPFTISFTSGSTGKPKALVQSVGAFFISLKDYGLHQNMSKEDVILSISSGGWISWNMMINCLQLGSTVCLYDGNPFLNSTYLWDIVDKFGLTVICPWTCTFEEMEYRNYVPTKKHSLKTLKSISPMGSPMKPKSFDFIAEKIGSTIYGPPIYGSTEMHGCVSGSDSNLPLYRGEIPCFSLGFDVRCVDENGTSLVNKRGNVVIANPVPGMPLYIFNDKNKQMLEEKYLKRFPGFWDMGDEGWINPETKGFIVYGRSDEILLSKGAKYSCFDIYFSLNGFPGIADCVCVSQSNKKLDVRIVLFVKLAPGYAFTHDFIEKIKEKISQDLSMEHIPDVILEAPDIPYSLTQKKMNLLVKKLINHLPVGNEDIVGNPSSLDFFKNVPELSDF